MRHVSFSLLLSPWSEPDSESLHSGFDIRNAVSTKVGDGERDASTSDADDEVEPVGDAERSRSSPSAREDDRDIG